MEGVSSALEERSVTQTIRLPNVNSLLGEEQGRLLEQLYVHDVYERIAEDFAVRKYKPWPKVKEFLSQLPPGSLVADIGCGNGHYIGVNKNISVIGIDRCTSLLAHSSEQRGGVVVRADMLSLPFPDNAFDAVLSVGVIHHLVSEARRGRALQEMNRILKPGGVILLYVWAWEQPKRKFEGQNLLVPRQFSDSYNGTEESCCLCNTVRDSSSPKRATSPSKIEQFKQFFLSSWSFNQRTPPSTSIHPTNSGSAYPQGFQVREFPASSLFAANYVKNSHQGSRREIKESQYGSNQTFNASFANCQNAELKDNGKPPTNDHFGGANRCYHNHGTHSPSRSRDERFYHVFKDGELHDLISKYTTQLNVVKCFYEAGNWCSVISKKN